MANRITINGIRDIRLRLEDIRKPVDRNTASAVGREVVSLIRSETAAGKSPITGGSYPLLDRKYAQRKKRGNTTPNLRLTGKFMDSLKFRVNQLQSGFSTTVGYFNRTSQKKEEGHRAGANNQGKRPTIPEGNETFSRRIQAKIRDIFEKRINFLIRRNR